MKHLTARYGHIENCCCREATELYPNIKTFTDHREMLESCPTDVVCVSTWPPSHRPITLDAIAYPLMGILVEKPLGPTPLPPQKSC